MHHDQDFADAATLLANKLRPGILVLNLARSVGMVAQFVLEENKEGEKIDVVEVSKLRQKKKRLNTGEEKPMLTRSGQLEASYSPS